MIAGKQYWIVAFLLSLIIAAVFILPVYAFTTDEIDAKQEELEEVEKRRSDQKSALEQRLNHEAALKQELKELENRIQELRMEQERLEQEIAAVKEEITHAESELAEAEERLSHQEDLLNLRLRAIQQHGVVSYIEVLFDSSSFSDFLTRLHNLSIIASNDLRLLEEIEAERDLVQAWKDELDQKKDDLESMHRQVAANEEEIKGALEERELILGELQKEINQNLKVIEDLEEEAERLDSEIRRLIAEAESQFSGVEGELHWPIEPPTTITSGYGWRRDPFSGNQAWHGGIDIAPRGGAANYILAAALGEVIYSGWNGGYGNCIMIDHGGGTVTLYAHMSSLLVGKGDIVDRGERIAQAGTTGYSTGVHLHFEVREYEKSPVRNYPSGSPDHRYDPMGYF